MKREILTTLDGSTTIHLPEWDESYHSKHGAIQEAYHVFINGGFSLLASPALENSPEAKFISILEIGFGTGLNAFITYLEAEKANKYVDYVGVEAYPVLLDEALQMNYVSELKVSEKAAIFNRMHQVSWNEKQVISKHFNLTKRQQFFQDISDVNQFDLIYFDAFGFRVQPELWSVELFNKMFTSLKSGGILVTYACRGSIKRAMLACGFQVEKLPGAPGKREMLRGIKK